MNLFRLLPLAAIMAAGAAGAGDSKVTLTFLDTLNKGREVVFVNPEAEQKKKAQALPAPRPDTQQVLPPTGRDPKRETGSVLSRFRIQVLATTQEQQARQEKGALAAKTGLPVSIVFEQPYYKLFAGEFTQRAEAENNLAQMKRMGYNDAWIVRSAINPR